MQIFLTEAFTFMGLKLDASGNAGATPIRIELYEHTVADEHFYSMQTHFTCEVCENDVPTGELYAKESIRKRLVDDSLHNLCISHICATKYSSACLYSQGLFGFGGHYVNLDGGRVGRERAFPEWFDACVRLLHAGELGDYSLKRALVLACKSLL